MTLYIIKRIGLSLMILVGILTVTFFIIRIAPGDPVTIFEAPGMDSNVRELIRHSYGLDQPIHIQYFKWLYSLLIKGNLGFSLVQNKPVSEILIEAVPNTIVLMGAGLLLNLILGISAGIASAARRYSKLDNAIAIAGLTFYSLPIFWFSLMLILVFCYLLPILPPSHMRSVDADSLGMLDRFLDLLKHLILPAVCIGLTSAATTARFTRAGLIEILEEDFIRTARAKGVSERSILSKHSLRNVLLPIVTLFGLYFPFLISGSLIVEVIFSWPGMGRITYNAILGRDYPLVIGATFAASVMVIAGNLIADTLYALVDPRVRFGDVKK